MPDFGRDHAPVGRPLAQPRQVGAVSAMLRMVLIGMTAALGLVACGDKSADLDPSQAVNIRVQNETGSKIERLWLGAGPEQGSTFQTRYTDIGAGGASDYLTVEPNVDNYRQLNLTIDGERYFGHSLDPQVALGIDELSAGSYYTFVLTLDGSDVVLSDLSVDNP